jgi:hypothetical protein
VYPGAAGGAAEPEHLPASAGAVAPAEVPGEPGPDWEPIVVDRPIARFEPRPPSDHSYRPDTICDGWSTPYARIRLASVRGYSHRYYGKPRQDHAEVVEHARSGVVIFAVADGVSSATRAEAGAQFACEAAIDAVMLHLNEQQLPDWEYVLRAAARRLTELAAGRRPDGRADADAVESAYATTLVAGIAMPAADGLEVSMARVGDSGAWILEGGRYRAVLDAKNDPRSAVVSSAVRPLPRVPEPVLPVRLLVTAGQVLLVGTDGFGDPLGDGDGEVGRLFADALAEPPPAYGMAHLLDFSRETYDDDRTLLALWPLAPGFGAAR